VRVKVVDLGGRELGDSEMAEVGLQVVLEEAPRLPKRARGPVSQSGGKPSIEQLRHTASAHAHVAGLGEKALELLARLAFAAPNRSRDPALSAARGVDARVNAQLPAVRTAFANRTWHRATLEGWPNNATSAARNGR